MSICDDCVKNAGLAAKLRAELFGIPMRLTWSSIISSFAGGLAALWMLLGAPVSAQQDNGFSSNLVGRTDTPVDGLVVESSPVNPEVNQDFDWLEHVRVGYDGGFKITSDQPVDLENGDSPFQLRFNGWGQLRDSVFNSDGVNPDQNQIQLQRARLVLSGSAFTSDFFYFVQLDGRSSSGDNLRLLDYYLAFDLGHHRWGFDKGTFVFKTGKYKMPYDLARFLTAREFEFTDRSVASTFFDVNRSLAWGLQGRLNRLRVPVDWEVAVFNGLVTGGAETGSSGDLDTNFAYSARAMWYPTGDWGQDQMADFDYRCQPATRVGFGWANSRINREGSTEFGALRVVDSGEQLSNVLPGSVNQYTVNLYSIDASMKYRGWSLTSEYYFRQIDRFDGAPILDLFDYGYWYQVGKFLVPGKFQVMTRWSRVIGNSGTLGLIEESSSEMAYGCVKYFRGQNAKFTFDATYLDGAPISSSALDVSPGDIGWLYRGQIQFAF
jgi:hypothetical protein